jgi:hypothetical protein
MQTTGQYRLKPTQMMNHTLIIHETSISVEKAAQKIGLTINENNTKFMALNDPACINLTHKRSFIIDSYNFEVMTEFTYLGSLINSKK